MYEFRLYQIVVPDSAGCHDLHLICILGILNIPKNTLFPKSRRHGFS